MLANHQPLGSCRSRNWRGLLAVLIAVVYLLAGALHGLHDIDVTTPAGGSEIAAVLDSSGHIDDKAPGGHHCHGCFSVAVAQPAPSAASIELVSASSPQPETPLAGIAPDTELPASQTSDLNGSAGRRVRPSILPSQVLFMFCRRTAARMACAMAILISPSLVLSSEAQTLTMRSALSRALATSPRLTAAERDVGIATGQRIQAGALLNPELSCEQDNSFGSGIYRGTKLAETTLQISQAFELFGKRDARIAAGAAGVEVAAIQRKAIRLEVLSETAIAFLSVLGAQRRIQILDEQITAIDRLTPLLRRRVEAGAVLAGRDRPRRSRIRPGQGRSRALQGHARQRPARARGTDGRSDAEILPTCPAGSTPRDGRPHSSRWSPRSMPIRSWCAGPRSMPSATPSCCWRGSGPIRTCGSRPGGAISTRPMTTRCASPSRSPSPCSTRTRATSSPRRKASPRRGPSAMPTRNTLVVIAGRAYDSLQGSLRELAVLRETAIPKAQEAAEAISQGYGQGRFTLLEVLDAQASVAQARLREQEALQNFHAGVATIEGLVGNPFSLARESAR